VLEDDLAHVPADLYLMTHATNPLLEAETIRRALSEFIRAEAEGTADSLFSVNKLQARFYYASGAPVNHDPRNLVRTQDLEPWFEENSNLYLFTRKSFGTTRARIGDRPMMFVTPKIESVDVDDQESWDLAEAIMRARLEAR
jgi:CMP-N-acetylneuraminic acid synthetase